MNLNDYGFTNDYISELDEQTITTGWIPARITAVHRERYQLVCEHGETYGRLKTKEYYGGCEAFPTTGD